MRRSTLDALMNSQTRSDVLSTRQVSQLLGVGEATVKRWADAGEIDCFRTPGGHRKFTLKDVTAFVQERHYEVAGGMPSARALGLAGDTEGAIRAMEQSALDGDAGACVAQMSALRLKGMTLAEIFDDVVTPTLHRVGGKWEKCQLSVAEEHIATGAIIDAIARAQPLAEPAGEPVRADRGSAVVASVAGDQHDVASRMVACLLRARGFEVLAPLAQTPGRDLAELVVRARARVVCLSSTAPKHSEPIKEQVDIVGEAAAQTGALLFCGGPGMAKLKLPAGARLLKRVGELVGEQEPAGKKRARA
ncbi:MAG: helix-turn-helix domain-containing protein [Deltaproteobacteria bacterium]|nr:helix-turn-helix domain-containing protein [Deltaproteobacteria bacterium]